MPQGSMFGTFLFSINLNDLYLFLNETEFCNFDDDTRKCRLENILTFQLKSFFEAKFKYCPLIWVFCSRITNNKINKPCKRSLRIVYGNLSNFQPRMVHSLNITKTFRHCQ